MKILEINSVCGITSTGRICTDLAELLIARGDTCYVTHGREPVPEKYRPIAVRIGTDVDMKLHGVQTRLFDRHGFASRRATLRFLDWVRSYDPDLIHLHNLHGYYLQVELLFDYLKQAGKPVVWTLHDCWSFTGHCPHFVSDNCFQWKTGCTGSCCRSKEYPTVWFGAGNTAENFQRKKAAFTGVRNLTLITPSKWLADLTRESFLQDYPVKVIPNGIDRTVFSPMKSDLRQRLGIAPDDIMVLGVANGWGQRKGLDDFIQLSKMVDKNVKIVLVGMNEKQAKNMPPQMIGVTHTHSIQELAQYYSAADVFLNPTHEDTFPTTNLEALACGTPVVTYRTGGSPESLDETCGIVVDAAPEQLMHAITAALSLRAEDCISRSRQYDKTTRFLEYLNLYDEVTRHGNEFSN